jgi:hypothetical protein
MQNETLIFISFGEGSSPDGNIFEITELTSSTLKLSRLDDDGDLRVATFKAQ